VLLELKRLSVQNFYLDSKFKENRSFELGCTVSDQFFVGAQNSFCKLYKINLGTLTDLKTIIKMASHKIVC